MVRNDLAILSSESSEVLWGSRRHHQASTGCRLSFDPVRAPTVLRSNQYQHPNSQSFASMSSNGDLCRLPLLTSQLGVLKLRRNLVCSNKPSLSRRDMCFEPRDKKFNKRRHFLSGGSERIAVEKAQCFCAGTQDLDHAQPTYISVSYTLLRLSLQRRVSPRCGCEHGHQSSKESIRR